MSLISYTRGAVSSPGAQRMRRLPFPCLIVRQDIHRFLDFLLCPPYGKVRDQKAQDGNRQQCHGKPYHGSDLLAEAIADALDRLDVPGLCGDFPPSSSADG